ncbi:hypothetical protein JW960_24065 [candidate division KSB1 bacterium]|nr:hypothetical protein [candidate division KSB1 bacterium]
MLDNNDAILADIPVKAGSKSIESWGISTGDNVFVWILNKNDLPVSRLVLVFPGLVQTKYTLKAYNTWNGDYSDIGIVEISAGQLHLENIHLDANKDMALWLEVAK